ncbi:acyl-CoA dehydrogenase family protein [Nocardia sp. NPDC056064]|uniref:acyl-CoA dehydrogenase family protein n=1 Tax=Nocardia sp. NPDC056064 TaxID=3345701 RepID=UPI0035DFEEB5
MTADINADGTGGLSRISLRRVLANADGEHEYAIARDWLHRALPDSAFAWLDAVTPYQRAEVMYARCRAAGRHAPPVADLIGRPENLATLMTRMVVANPSMFHFCIVHYTLTVAPMLAAGTIGPGLRPILADLAKMNSFGVALLTEAAEYSRSHLHPRTRAEYDPATREFVLDSPTRAAAKYPNNSACPTVPKTAAVYAQLVINGIERGMFVFIVVLRDPDGTLASDVELIAAPDTSALPSDYAYVRFDRKRVPFDTWLPDGATISADGDFTDPEPGSDARRTRTMRVPGPLVWMCIVAGSAGVAQATAKILHRHSRGHFSGAHVAPELPLIEFRAVRAAVTDATAAGYALALVSRYAAGNRPADEPRPAGASTWAPWSAVDGKLALLKVAANLLCSEVATTSRILCGASGFTADDRLNAYVGWAAAYDSGGGANDLILLDTAHAMVNGINYLPPEPLSPDPTADLTDLAQCLAIARALESRLGSELSHRWSAAEADGVAEFDFWCDNQPLALLTATTYADRIVLELLAGGEATLPAPVGQLLRVHALATLRKHTAALVDFDVVPPGFSPRLWRAHDQLCDALVPWLDDLVDAIDFPDLVR